MNFLKKWLQRWVGQGILTGPEIKRQRDLGRIEILPWDEKNLNPNSYNLRVGDTCQMYTNIDIFNVKDPRSFSDLVNIKIPDEGLILRPGNLYLIPTLEKIGTDYYEPMFTGRSSMGRLGVRIHQEAGFCDIGYHGNLTMQVQVTYPTRIYRGTKIAQIYFFTAVGDIQLYNGRYQNSRGAVGSKGV